MRRWWKKKRNRKKKWIKSFCGWEPEHPKKKFVDTSRQLRVYVHTCFICDVSEREPKKPLKLQYISFTWSSFFSLLWSALKHNSQSDISKSVYKYVFNKTFWHIVFFDVLCMMVHWWYMSKNRSIDETINHATKKERERERGIPNK